MEFLCRLADEFSQPKGEGHENVYVHLPSHFYYKSAHHEPSQASEAISTSHSQHVAP